MYVLMYLAAIVAANLSVAYFGPAASIVNAFLFIGLDLTARDALHEQWNGRHLVRNMAALIAAGAVLSWLLNASAGRIALASFVAFAAAAIIDTAVYQLLHGRSWLVKMNGSNVPAAAVDSLIFPLIAFGWPPLIGIMVGQFIAKSLGGLAWSFIISFVGRKELAHGTI